MAIGVGAAVRASLRRVGRPGFAVVRGRSMEPTLYEGDRLLVRHGGRPRAGRLVVARVAPDGLGSPPSLLVIKRAARRTPRGWWLDRDNPVAGSDSWLFGSVPDADIVATVVCRVWPVARRSRAGPWRLWQNRQCG